MYVVDCSNFNVYHVQNDYYFLTVVWIMCLLFHNQKTFEFWYSIQLELLHLGYFDHWELMTQETKSLCVLLIQNEIQNIGVYQEIGPCAL